MKRMMMVWVMILCLVPSACLSEQPDRLRPETVERITRFVDPDSAAASSGILRVDDLDTYTEYTLANEYDTGEGLEMVPAAILRTDHETGSVIYYRRADFRLPTLAGAKEWTLMDEAGEPAMASWQDWASQAYCALLGVMPDEAPVLMICPDQATCAFVLSGDPEARAIDAMLICSLPSAENELPQLRAYVDLTANPDCGYDGCMTAAQAAHAGREAIRARFGDDAAACLTVESHSFVLYDYGIHVDVSTDEVPDAGWERVVVNPDHPTWSFAMIDERANPAGDQFEPGHENAYRYYVAVDAITGEIVHISDAPEAFAFG